MTRARLYGLAVDSDVDLHGAGDPFEGPADVVVRSRPRFDTWADLPDGETLLDFATGRDHWYVLVREPSGRLLLRIPTLGDFRIDADLSRVEVAMHVDAAEGMDGVLTTGTLLSCLLFLGGSTVLHGSATELDGGAVGFIGHSGQGKTTMAAAMCVEGAALVTDDVLVVEAARGIVPSVRRGSGELRLRDGTLALVGAGAADASRTSADARTVLTPRPVLGDLPLRGIVIPHPRRDGSPLRLERLAGMDAALAVMTFPRLRGWRDPHVLSRYFAVATAVAAQVPVMVAHMPWDRPFERGLTDALRGALI